MLDENPRNFVIVGGMSESRKRPNGFFGETSSETGDDTRFFQKRPRMWSTEPLMTEIQSIENKEQDWSTRIRRRKRVSSDAYMDTDAEKRPRLLDQVSQSTSLGVADKGFHHFALVPYEPSIRTLALVDRTPPPRNCSIIPYKSIEPIVPFAPLSRCTIVQLDSDDEDDGDPERSMDIE